MWQTLNHINGRCPIDDSENISLAIMKIRTGSTLYPINLPVHHLEIFIFFKLSLARHQEIYILDLIVCLQGTVGIVFNELVNHNGDRRIQNDQIPWTHINMLLIAIIVISADIQKDRDR